MPILKKKISKKTKAGNDRKRSPRKDEGRPTKLNKTFLTGAKATIKEMNNEIFIFTDEELCSAINTKLCKNAQISYVTFRNYKRNVLEFDKLTDEEKVNVPKEFKEFLSVIKEALRKEKQHLMTKLMEDDKQWQRWAWIIERKFNDWNLRNKLEIDNNIRVKEGGVHVYIPHNKRDPLPTDNIKKDERKN